MIYVCDRCGNQTVGEIRGGDPYRCDKCGASAGWEFPSDRTKAAEHQSARIAAHTAEARSFGLLNDGRMRT